MFWSTLVAATSGNVNVTTFPFVLIAVGVTVPPRLEVTAKSAIAGVVVGASDSVTCTVVALIALIFPIILEYFP